MIMAASDERAAARRAGRRMIGVTVTLAILVALYVLAATGSRVGRDTPPAPVTTGAALPNPHASRNVHDADGPSTLTTPNATEFAPAPAAGPLTPTTPKGR
jgi:hypothetical protein